MRQVINRIFELLEYLTIKYKEFSSYKTYRCIIECKFGNFGLNRVPIIEGNSLFAVFGESVDECKKYCASDNRCHSFSSCIDTIAGCDICLTQCSYDICYERFCYFKDRKLLGNEETKYKDTCQTFFKIYQGKFRHILFKTVTFILWF